MTSPPSPPNRRRRRIVVAVVVLVVGLGWWYWPRVDQRFVGTWKLFDENGELDRSWTLRSDGFLDFPTPNPGVTEFIPWKVSDEQFELGTDPARWSQFVQPIADFVSRYTSTMVTYGDGAERYRVASAAPDEIVLVDEDGKRLTLRRHVE